MMSNRNVLITADLHLYNHKGETCRAEDGLQCLEWIYSVASKNNIDKVIIAGDFVHHRFNLNAYIYSKACKIVANAKTNGIDTIFLVGNHDMYYEDNWELHSLIPFKKWTTVIDKPETIDINGISVDFLPYTPTPSKYLNSFNKHDGKSKRILISHLAIADAVLNSRFDIKSVEDDSKEKEVISVSAFKQWDKVWLGHYHYGQQVSENTEYIGSPMQLSFGEANQEKHVAIFNLETLETKYIVNDVSPKFIITSDHEKLLNEDIKNAYIQLTESDASIDSKFELKKQLSNLGVRNVEFIGSKVDIIQKDTGVALKNIGNLFSDKEKLFDEFLKHINLPENLDIAVVKKLIRNIINT